MNVFGYLFGGPSAVPWIEYFQYIVYLTLQHQCGFKTVFDLGYLSWKEQN